ncbi:MAG: zinc-dependent alcohol dehydrogenase family protein [Promethearchaeota archaeon]
MIAARFNGPFKIDIKEEDIPKLNDDEILVKIKASGICGTDHHIFKGEIKGLVKMGTVLGHEFCGIIEKIAEKGEHLKELNEGDRVAIEPNLFCGACHYCRNAKKHFCKNWSAIGLSRDGGFAEYCAVPASAVYKMPKGLDFQSAAFFEPMACVLHGIERSRIKVGETVIVQGAGSIGLLYTQALSNLGVDKIIVSDVDQEKLKLAKQFGATSIVNVNNEDLIEVVKSETDGEGAQVFIDAAGLLSTISTALKTLENTGRILIFGVPPEGQKTEIIPYEIYRREIEIIGSFTNPYTNEAALKLLKKINTKPIITNPIKLKSLVEDGLNQIGKPGVIKVQIQNN